MTADSLRSSRRNASSTYSLRLGMELELVLEPGAALLKIRPRRQKAANLFLFEGIPGRCDALHPPLVPGVAEVPEAVPLRHLDVHPSKRRQGLEHAVVLVDYGKVTIHL